MRSFVQARSGIWKRYSETGTFRRTPAARSTDGPLVTRGRSEVSADRDIVPAQIRVDAPPLSPWPEDDGSNQHTSASVYLRYNGRGLARTSANIRRPFRRSARMTTQVEHSPGLLRDEEAVGSVAPRDVVYGFHPFRGFRPGSGCHLRT